MPEERKTMAVGIEEYDIRQWFMTAALEQARDTFRVVEGILEMREASKPKRVQRKDAGQPRGLLLPGVQYDGKEQQ